jgi:hypothetical protein
MRGRVSSGSSEENNLNDLATEALSQVNLFPANQPEVGESVHHELHRNRS